MSAMHTPPWLVPSCTRRENEVDENATTEKLQVEITASVLCRLLRERSLVASEVRCLNRESSIASWQAVKASALSD